MFGLYQAVGLAGLLLLAALVVTLAALLIQRLLRAGWPSLGTAEARPALGETSAVVLAGVTALASSPSWGPRPQILNLLLAAALCLVLLRWRRRPGRWLLWLVPAFVVWANLHSGYLFGAGLVGLFALGETIDRRGHHPWLLWSVAAGCLAAGLLTPSGWRTVAFPLGTLGSTTIQSNIQEWLTPDFHSLPGLLFAAALGILVAGRLGALPPPAADRGSSPLATTVERLWAAGGAATFLGLVLASPDFHQTLPRLVLLAFALAAVAWVVRSRHGSTAEPLWAIATAVLALTSLRHVALFAAAGAPALGRAAATLLAALGARPRRPVASPAMGVVNAAVLAVLGVLMVVFVAGRITPGTLDARLKAVEPVGAVDRMLAAPVPQPLFNFYDWGGYLVWRADPPYRVFIDGRVEIYGDALFARYLDVSYGTARWRRTLADYRIRTVLLPTGHPLGPFLLDAGWTVAYRDRTATVYVLG